MNKQTSQNNLKLPAHQVNKKGSFLQISKDENENERKNSIMA